MKRLTTIVLAGVMLTATLAHGSGDLIVDGKLGVGTTSPRYKLDVIGDINASAWITAGGGASSYYGMGLTIASNELSTTDPDYNRALGDPIYRINYHTGISMSAHSTYGGIRFYNQGFNVSNPNPYDSTIGAQMVMAITGGKVGIGTTTPNAKLDVIGDIKASAWITTGGGASSYNGTGLTIASNELSTTDPDYNRALGDPIYRINYQTGVSISAHSTYGGIRFYNQGFSVSNPNPYDSTIGSQMVMAITGGNVGIGTTTPNAKLDVAGSILGRDLNGNTVNLTSDAKFKKNLLPITTPLDKVLSLNGHSYEWKTGEYKEKNFPAGRHYGVIAQEIEKVLPEVVNTDSKGEKSVAYTEIIPVLIEAIKEQQKRIDQLEKKLSQMNK